jgi:hypothetical protein
MCLLLGNALTYGKLPPPGALRVMNTAPFFERNGGSSWQVHPYDDADRTIVNAILNAPDPCEPILPTGLPGQGAQQYRQLRLLESISGDLELIGGVTTGFSQQSSRGRPSAYKLHFDFYPDRFKKSLQPCGKFTPEGGAPRACDCSGECRSTRNFKGDTLHRISRQTDGISFFQYVCGHRPSSFYRFKFDSKEKGVHDLMLFHGLQRMEQIANERHCGQMYPQWDTDCSWKFTLSPAAKKEYGAYVEGSFPCTPEKYSPPQMTPTARLTQLKNDISSSGDRAIDDEDDENCSFSELLMPFEAAVAFSASDANRDWFRHVLPKSWGDFADVTKFPNDVVVPPDRIPPGLVTLGDRSEPTTPKRQGGQKLMTEMPGFHSSGAPSTSRKRARRTFNLDAPNWEYHEAFIDLLPVKIWAPSARWPELEDEQPCAHCGWLAAGHVTLLPPNRCSLSHVRGLQDIHLGCARAKCALCTTKYYEVKKELAQLSGKQDAALHKLKSAKQKARGDEYTQRAAASMALRASHSCGSEQLSQSPLGQPSGGLRQDESALSSAAMPSPSEPPTTSTAPSSADSVRAAEELVDRLDKEIESKSLELSSIHMTFVVSDSRYLKLLEGNKKWAWVPYLLGTYNAYKSACTDSLAWLIFHLKAAENHKMKLLKDLRNRQQTHNGAASILWQVAGMEADDVPMEKRKLIQPQLQCPTMSRNWIAAVSNNMLAHYSTFMNDWQSGHPRSGITSVDHTGKLLARAGKLTGGSNPLKWAWGQRDGFGLVHSLVFTRTQGYRDESLIEATAADEKIRREFTHSDSKVIYVDKPSDIRLIREVMFRGGGLEEYTHGGKIVYGCVGGSSAANGEEYDGYDVHTLQEAITLLSNAIHATESPRRAGLATKSVHVDTPEIKVKQEASVIAFSFDGCAYVFSAPSERSGADWASFRKGILGILSDNTVEKVANRIGGDETRLKMLFGDSTVCRKMTSLNDKAKEVKNAAGNRMFKAYSTEEYLARTHLKWMCGALVNNNYWAVTPLPGSLIGSCAAKATAQTEALEVFESGNFPVPSDANIDDHGCGPGGVWCWRVKELLQSDGQAQSAEGVAKHGQDDDFVSEMVRSEIPSGNLPVGDDGEGEDGDSSPFPSAHLMLVRENETSDFSQEQIYNACAAQIKSYACSSSSDDFHLSSTANNATRKRLHTLAGATFLRHTSEGVGGERHVVLSRFNGQSIQPGAGEGCIGFLLAKGDSRSPTTGVVTAYCNREHKWTAEWLNPKQTADRKAKKSGSGKHTTHSSQLSLHELNAAVNARWAHDFGDDGRSSVPQPGLVGLDCQHEELFEQHKGKLLHDWDTGALSRFKYGGFHFIKNAATMLAVDKKTVLAQKFVSDCSHILYKMMQGEFDGKLRARHHLISQGKSPADLAFTSRKWLRRNVRYHCPPPKQILREFCLLVSVYASMSDPARRDAPVLVPGWKDMFAKLAGYIGLGLLSDPTHCSVYLELPHRTRASGFKVYRCMRGELIEGWWAALGHNFSQGSRGASIQFFNQYVKKHTFFANVDASIAAGITPEVGHPFLWYFFALAAALSGSVPERSWPEALLGFKPLPSRPPNPPQQVCGLAPIADRIYGGDMSCLDSAADRTLLLSTEQLRSMVTQGDTIGIQRGTKELGHEIKTTQNDLFKFRQELLAKNAASYQLRIRAAAFTSIVPRIATGPPPPPPKRPPKQRAATPGSAVSDEVDLLELPGPVVGERARKTPGRIASNGKHFESKRPYRRDASGDKRYRDDEGGQKTYSELASKHGKAKARALRARSNRVDERILNKGTVTKARQDGCAHLEYEGEFIWVPIGMVPAAKMLAFSGTQITEGFMENAASGHPAFVPHAPHKLATEDTLVAPLLAALKLVGRSGTEDQLVGLMRAVMRVARTQTRSVGQESVSLALTKALLDGDALVRGRGKKDGAPELSTYQQEQVFLAEATLRSIFGTEATTRFHMLRCTCSSKLSEPCGGTCLGAFYPPAPPKVDPVTIGTCAKFMHPQGAFHALNPQMEGTECQYVVDSACATKAVGTTCRIKGADYRIDQYDSGTDEWECSPTDGHDGAIKVAVRDAVINLSLQSTSASESLVRVRGGRREIRTTITALGEFVLLRGGDVHQPGPEASNQVVGSVINQAGDRLVLVAAVLYTGKTTSVRKSKGSSGHYIFACRHQSNGTAAEATHSYKILDNNKTGEHDCKCGAKKGKSKGARCNGRQIRFKGNGDDSALQQLRVHMTQTKLTPQVLLFRKEGSWESDPLGLPTPQSTPSWSDNNCWAAACLLLLSMASPYQSMLQDISTLRPARTDTQSADVIVVSDSCKGGSDHVDRVAGTGTQCADVIVDKCSGKGVGDRVAGTGTQSTDVIVVSDNCSGEGGGDRVVGIVGSRPVFIEGKPVVDKLNRTVWRNVSHWVPIEQANRVTEAGAKKAIAMAVATVNNGGSNNIDAVVTLTIAPKGQGRRPTTIPIHNVLLASIDCLLNTDAIVAYTRLLSNEFNHNNRVCIASSSVLQELRNDETQVEVSEWTGGRVWSLLYKQLEEWQTIEYVALPFAEDGHWSLVLYQVSTGELQLYDSMRVGGHRTHADDLRTQVARLSKLLSAKIQTLSWVLPGKGESGLPKSVKVTQQFSGGESYLTCGVSVLVCCRMILTGICYLYTAADLERFRTLIAMDLLNGKISDWFDPCDQAACDVCRSLPPAPVAFIEPLLQAGASDDPGTALTPAQMPTSPAKPANGRRVSCRGAMRKEKEDAVALIEANSTQHGVTRGKLECRNSAVGPDAGQGLFATGLIRKKSVVAILTGVRRSTYLRKYNGDERAYRQALIDELLLGVKVSKYVNGTMLVDSWLADLAADHRPNQEAWKQRRRQKSARRQAAFVVPHDGGLLQPRQGTLAPAHGATSTQTTIAFEPSICSGWFKMNCFKFDGITAAVGASNVKADLVRVDGTGGDVIRMIFRAAEDIKAGVELLWQYE